MGTQARLMAAPPSVTTLITATGNGTLDINPYIAAGHKTLRWQGLAGGAGGGSGGASLNGFNSGAGGNGGSGFARFTAMG